MSQAIHILLDESIGTIRPEVHGHFIEHLGACIYEGLWVGVQERIAHSGGVCSDVLEALRRLAPPVLRWPGGCFADDYHWQDGVGPQAQRPRRVNLHWGHVIETNAFGTHEFIHLCRALGAEPYLCGNVGSGSPRELRDWMEYCNFPVGSTLSDQRAANGDARPFDVRYWGVGNENWGCGGHFRPEDYAGEYRRFATYLRGFGDTSPFLIACGPDGNDVQWTMRFFNRLLADGRACNLIHGYGAHYYCGTAGTATQYDENQWYELLWKAQRMEDLVLRQRAAMDVLDPQRRVGLIIDEWGTWHPPTPGRNPKFLWQQNTLRDALVAAMTLDIFHRHADKVVMANIAQLVNVLQALLLTENGRVIRTPTYHVFDLYRNHRGAQAVRAMVETEELAFSMEGGPRRLPWLAASASLRNRTLTLTVTNVHLTAPAEVVVDVRGASAALVRQTVLTHADPQAHNTLDDPDRLAPGEPQILPIRGESLPCRFPPRSVTRLEMSLV